MRTGLAWFLFGCLGASACSPAAAQDVPLPVSIEHSGNGRIGNLLAHEIRQEILQRPALSVAENIDEGWKLVLLTIDGAGEAAGSTIYSVTLVRKNFDREFDSYVTGGLGLCRGSELPGCARDIVTDIEGPMADYRLDWGEGVPAGELADEVAAEAVPE